MLGERFNPDPNALLDILLPLIDDGMLRQIAEADYGNDAELHLAALHVLRDERVMSEVGWYPEEVLRLIRWSEPDKFGWKPGDVGTRGHLLRAFACATRLKFYAEAKNDRDQLFDSVAGTTIQLLDSLKALGGKMVPAGVRFFAWCVNSAAPHYEDGEDAIFALALLSLRIRNYMRPDDEIVFLCKWIDGRVSLLLWENQWAVTRPEDWLLAVHNGTKNDRWIELGRDLYR